MVEHTIVGGKLALRYLKDVKSVLEVHDLDGKLVREIALPTLGSSSNLIGDADDDEAYYAFTSFTYPNEIFRTQVASGTTTSWYKQKLPVDPTRFDVEQRFATSKDGTKVPFFVVHAKDFVKDGSAPAILYGYGGFQSAVTPGFNSTMVPWLERGGIYVVANLRGGSEYGEDWHRAGMRHVKQNVFDDFFAVGESLIAERYTRADRLAARGGSNGGLLVGAAITQRPDLFTVGLCGVPLLDMVRYHLFGSGKTWIEEYGSADDPEDFKALFAYSPYHHVTTGTEIPRGAPPLAPTATIASIRCTRASSPPSSRRRRRAGRCSLRIEKHRGHGGSDLVKAAVERGADELAFALDQMR